jgi:hypothetical protein
MVYIAHKSGGTAAGQTRGEVIERLALTLDTWLDQPGAPPGQQG